MAFQALAVLFLVLVYGRLWMAERRRGSGWMFAGFVLTLIAGVAQAMKHIELHAIWTFDHNGIYHLIQMPGVGGRFQLTAIFLESGEWIGTNKYPGVPSGTSSRSDAARLAA